MQNILVINKRFYDSINSKKNLDIVNSFGYRNADAFFLGICKKLNEEYEFTKLDNYRFQTDEETKKFSMFTSFIEGNVAPYKKVFLSFTPIESKLGNTNIVQEVMPMIATQMKESLTFLLDKEIKKICLLTSKFNMTNTISKDYNTLQMNVNSLNTINFDVIPFFMVKNLSTDILFNSLTEYLEMVEFLQKKNLANDQFKYFTIEGDTLFGHALAHQIKGQWQKTFVFKFLTAIFSGKNKFKYNIENVLQHGVIDNQLKNLKRFIDFINTTSESEFMSTIEIPFDDVIDSNDDVEDTDNLNRMPEQGIGKSGRKRYKTQRKIKQFVLETHNYLCNCHDLKHFYFESSDSFNNYVEGHHMIPMNRQTEYWEDKKTNLDVESNIVPLCPTCHAQIHLGSRRARLDILSEIYVREELKLKRVDKDLDLIKLASYYNIGLELEEKNYLLSNAIKKIHKKDKREV